MYTVTVTSLKGGSGKTNFCAAASVEFERLGFGPVALIDTDPQGSLSHWWNARESPTPQFAAVDIKQLPTHLKSLQNDGINLTIIDTPPAISNVIHAAIDASNLAVVPVRPSPSDLRAVGVSIAVEIWLLATFRDGPANGREPQSGSSKGLLIKKGL